jgi:hypothetical protein
MRNEKGQFVKGYSASPKTQFKKGEHWRHPQAFRDKEWLTNEYEVKKRSTGEIAKKFGVTDAAIIFWLRKHGISRRNTSDARAIKKWGSVGADNPMWNKRGELNPRWQGGITPERQSFYQSQEWKSACSFVWKRDNATCQRCKLHKSESMDIPFHIHHIKPFKHVELRAEVSNLILLCEICHQFVHSKKNTNNEYL